MLYDGPLSGPPPRRRKLKDFNEDDLEQAINRVLDKREQAKQKREWERMQPKSGEKFWP